MVIEKENCVNEKEHVLNTTVVAMKSHPPTKPKISVVEVVVGLTVVTVVLVVLVVVVGAQAVSPVVRHVLIHVGLQRRRARADVA